MNADIYKAVADAQPLARAEEFKTGGAWFLWHGQELCGVVHSAFVAETWCDAINLGASAFGVNSGGRW